MPVLCEHEAVKEALLDKTDDFSDCCEMPALENFKVIVSGINKDRNDCSVLSVLKSL